MYKVVRIQDGKRVSAIMSECFPFFKWRKTYSTKVPVDNGFVFKTLKQAENFHKVCLVGNIEIWKIKASKYRRVKRMAELDFVALRNYNVKEHFMKKWELHTELPSYLKGTRYAINILLVKKVA